MTAAEQAGRGARRSRTGAGICLVAVGAFLLFPARAPVWQPAAAQAGQPS
ncbi:MAG: hypothetical protein ACLQDY_06320 [Streptosporangiaceae bacterium]